MKTTFKVLLLIFGLAFLFAQCEKEPLKKEPFSDANFLKALIQCGVDTDGDGLISNPEAEAILSLDIHNKGIHDMTGIEAFINLTYLHCSSNPIVSLDVSNNLNLDTLECEFTKLTALDVSQNTKLKWLGLSGDYLTSLDVSNNLYLDDLDLSNNLFTTLDVSNNDRLRRFNVDSMQSLSQVCVWTMPFPPEGLSLNTSESPNVYFTTECSK